MKDKIFFTPLDGISVSLLESIRQKVKAMVTQLEIKNHNSGSIGPVTWDFGSDNDSVQCGFISVLDGVTIRWDEAGLVSDDPRLVNIANNMDHFVEIEKSIYSVLEAAYVEQESKK